MIKVFLFSCLTYISTVIPFWIIESKLNIVFSKCEMFFIVGFLYIAMNFHRATFNALDKLEEKEKSEE